MEYEPSKAASARRAQLNKICHSFGAQVLGIDQRFPDYSADNAERFKLIARKGILEPLGRHLMFLRAVDGDVDGAAADAREIAGSLLKDGKPGVKDVSAYLQWIRKDSGIG